MAKNKFMLGQDVEYIDTKKHPKLAKVVAVPGQIALGGSLEPLLPGFYNVLIFSPTGQAYSRYSVPEESTADKIADYKDGNGDLQNFLRVLEDHFEEPQASEIEASTSEHDSDDDDDLDDLVEDL